MKPAKSIKMWVSDLDGTLLEKNGRISQANLEVFRKLGREKVIRVIATGRNLFSFTRVLPPESLPLDYLVFATGTGILDIQSRELIYRKCFAQDDVIRIGRILIEKEISFMIQAAVPDNHYFHFTEGRRVSEDFKRRLEVYDGFGSPLQSLDQLKETSQFLAILDGGLSELQQLSPLFRDYRIIRTTSPLDHKSTWMEIFPQEVSKGEAVNFLAGRHGIHSNEVLCVGNDYNDVEMLDYAGLAFVTDNAPSDLKQTYIPVCHPKEDVLPFIHHWLHKSAQYPL
jgi:hypothetical protein